MDRPLCPRCGTGVIRRGQVHDRVSGKKGQQRYWCRGCNWHGVAALHPERSESAGIDRGGVEALSAEIAGGKRRRYVVTSAQNATPPHKRFLASLLAYCSINDAQLIVIPYRYKNPTAFWSEQAGHDDWWSPELAPYLFDKRVELAPGLTLMADIKTQPTAPRPLWGFETMSGVNSAIIGHPKIELKTVATPQSFLPKILTTTGAVTRKNYLPSKAGKRGEFHHSFGACAVETDGERTHIRQLCATEEGRFCDLDREYSPAGAAEIQPDALVMGDTHVRFVDPGVIAATLEGPDSIVHALKPRTLVWHDVLDFHSGSHHHRHKIFIQYAKHHAGENNVEREIDQVFAFIDRHSPPWAKNIIVASNHHEHFARWVNETDPRGDPENAVFWARTFEAMCLGSRMTDTGPRTIDPLAWWAQSKLRCYPRTRFLARNESFTIRGVEVGFHGDHGADGARGSREAYRKVGIKTVIGHSHSPGILEGAYQVGGSSRLGLEYLRGPSSWMHTHCLIYPNGKRALLNIINGKWRLCHEGRDSTVAQSRRRPSAADAGRRGRGGRGRAPQTAAPSPKPAPIKTSPQ